MPRVQQQQLVVIFLLGHKRGHRLSLAKRMALKHHGQHRPIDFWPARINDLAAARASVCFVSAVPRTALLIRLIMTSNERTLRLFAVYQNVERVEFSIKRERETDAATHFNGRLEIEK